MSEDSLQFNPHALRRTLSTGDIPSRDTPRPQRARISASHRPPTEAAPAATVPDPEAPLPVPEIQPYQTWYGRTMTFFGYGRRASKARKALVSLVWNLTWGVVQFAVIVVLLAFSTHLESRTSKGVNEWHACDRPLGIWNCLWIVRIFLACGLSYLGCCRERKTYVLFLPWLKLGIDLSVVVQMKVKVTLNRPVVLAQHPHDPAQLPRTETQSNRQRPIHQDLLKANLPVRYLTLIFMLGGWPHPITRSSTDF